MVPVGVKVSGLNDFKEYLECHMKLVSMETQAIEYFVASNLVEHDMVIV